jgi:hypothetical protein
MAGFYEIETYEVRYSSTKLGTNWGGFNFKNHGLIICKGLGTGDLLVITIAPDDEPLHIGKTVHMPNGPDHGFIAIRRADLGAFIDLLRNEKPVYMEIKSPPLDSFNRIFTGAEPAGEGENTTS